METFGNIWKHPKIKKIKEKNRSKYVCEICLYSSFDLRNFRRHLQSIKHSSNFSNFDASLCVIMRHYASFSENYGLGTNTEQPTQPHDNDNEKGCGNIWKPNHKHECQNCSKLYKSRSGLYKHKKKCDKKYESLTEKIDNISKRVETLSSKPYIIENNTINNTLNIETFLNTKCGNAMNFLDFIHTLQITSDDIIRMGQIGFIQSYNELVTNKIKNMDITERPAHCINKHKQKFVVRHNDKWLKDDKNKIMNSSINILKDRETQIWYAHSQKALQQYETDQEVNERIQSLNEISNMCGKKYNDRIIKDVSKLLYLEP